ncbi:phage portal protein [Brevundimonas sp. 2R-24]|uniref:Phage portal protein n=1 Tax=Peiella sedimenti TaxID=3061083 RepID=A0ABT8SHQ2_9CAUL|nr:phage portal protein [Caulobacteraceae bacterium XZ-24]
MIDWRRPFGRRREAAPETKESAAGPLIALSGPGRPVWTPRDYESLAREGFARNAVAYRCVRMIAEAAASCPLAVFEKGERRDDHPLARLIARPNPEQAGAELLEQLYGYLQTSGNAYLEAVGEGEPEELYALRPDRVKVIPGPVGWPAGYEYAVGGRATRLMRAGDGFSPVLHLKLFNPADDWYGFSPLEAAAFAIDVHNASGAWNKALLDNAARPSGALVYGAKDGTRLTDEQFDRLKAELAADHAGQANAGRPLLLEGGLEWRAMSLSPAEMDFIAGKAAAAREIGLAFGVPSQLLGIPGDQTYANYREANAAFWRGAVAPLVRKTAHAMTAWIAPRFPDLRIEPDLEAVPALQPERDALWARLEAASFLTDVERRRLAGLEAG